ncbi:MAG: ribosome maturation factor RimM [Chitinispirillales bacterium]|jgi:16S rRNA processing protein RimM|nr:ribosome maturation factor RimM [Chitinispirillales bacterium]
MDLVAIAVVKRAIGLNGHCAALAHGETLGALKAPIGVYIGEDGRRASEATLKEVELRPQGYVVLFEGVCDRTAAEALQGQSVFVREDQLPQLADGQYYHFRLKGMAVVTESSGKKIGTVRDTVNLPSMDALDVVLANGHDAIIPYNEQAVVRVDDERREIVVSDSYIEELL